SRRRRLVKCPADAGVPRRQRWRYGYPASMASPWYALHRRLAQLFPHAFGREPETSRLIVGSTGSGKSEGELRDLVRLADARRGAIVLLDGHGPLAFKAAGHWEARGHEARMVYEPLRATSTVLCWNMLPRSQAASLSDRRI